jgi:hypothetical protein
VRFTSGLLFAAWFAGATVDALVALGPTRGREVARALVTTVLLVLDAGAAPTERRRMPWPAICLDLRACATCRAVLYERTDDLEGAAQALYFSIFHGKTLVNGYGGFTSPARVREPAPVRVSGRVGARASRRARRTPSSSATRRPRFSTDGSPGSRPARG